MPGISIHYVRQIIISLLAGKIMFTYRVIVFKVEDTIKEFLFSSALQKFNRKAYKKLHHGQFIYLRQEIGNGANWNV